MQTVVTVVKKVPQLKKELHCRGISVSKTSIETAKTKGAKNRKKIPDGNNSYEILYFFPPNHDYWAGSLSLPWPRGQPVLEVLFLLFLLKCHIFISIFFGGTTISFRNSVKKMIKTIVNAAFITMIN